MSAEGYPSDEGLDGEHGDNIKWEADGAPGFRDLFNDTEYASPNPRMTELNENE